jgi:hypothetical protein
MQDQLFPPEVFEKIISRNANCMLFLSSKGFSSYKGTEISQETSRQDIKLEFPDHYINFCGSKDVDWESKYRELRQLKYSGLSPFAQNTIVDIIYGRMETLSDNGQKVRTLLFNPLITDKHTDLVKLTRDYNHPDIRRLFLNYAINKDPRSLFSAHGLSDNPAHYLAYYMSPEDDEVNEWIYSEIINTVDEIDKYVADTHKGNETFRQKLFNQYFKRSLIYAASYSSLKYLTLFLSFAKDYSNLKDKNFEQAAISAIREKRVDNFTHLINEMKIKPKDKFWHQSLAISINNNDYEGIQINLQSPIWKKEHYLKKYGISDADIPDGLEEQINAFIQKLIREFWEYLCKNSSASTMQRFLIDHHEKLSITAPLLNELSCIQDISMEKRIFLHLFNFISQDNKDWESEDAAAIVFLGKNFLIPAKYEKTLKQYEDQFCYRAKNKINTPSSIFEEDLFSQEIYKFYETHPAFFWDILKDRILSKFPVSWMTESYPTDYYFNISTARCLRALLQLCETRGFKLIKLRHFLNNPPQFNLLIADKSSSESFLSMETSFFDPNTHKFKEIHQNISRILQSHTIYDQNIEDFTSKTSDFKIVSFAETALFNLNEFKKIYNTLLQITRSQTNNSQIHPTAEEFYKNLFASQCNPFKLKVSATPIILSKRLNELDNQLTEYGAPGTKEEELIEALNPALGTDYTIEDLHQLRAWRAQQNIMLERKNNKSKPESVATRNKRLLQEKLRNHQTDFKLLTQTCFPYVYQKYSAITTAVSIDWKFLFLDICINEYRNLGETQLNLVMAVNLNKPENILLSPENFHDLMKWKDAADNDLVSKARNNKQVDVLKKLRHALNLVIRGECQRAIIDPDSAKQGTNLLFSENPIYHLAYYACETCNINETISLIQHNIDTIIPTYCKLKLYNKNILDATEDYLKQEIKYAAQANNLELVNQLCVIYAEKIKPFDVFLKTEYIALPAARYKSLNVLKQIFSEIKKDMPSAAINYDHGNKELKKIADLWSRFFIEAASTEDPNYIEYLYEELEFLKENAISINKLNFKISHLEIAIRNNKDKWAAYILSGIKLNPNNYPSLVWRAVLNDMFETVFRFIEHGFIIDLHDPDKNFSAYASSDRMKLLLKLLEYLAKKGANISKIGYKKFTFLNQSILSPSDIYHYAEKLGNWILKQSDDSNAELKQLYDESNGFYTEICMKTSLDCFENDLTPAPRNNFANLYRMPVVEHKWKNNFTNLYRKNYVAAFEHIALITGHTPISHIYIKDNDNPKESYIEFFMQDKEGLIYSLRFVEKNHSHMNSYLENLIAEFNLTPDDKDPLLRAFQLAPVSQEFPEIHSPRSGY